MNPIAQRLINAKNAVVISGSGMSAESGLTDFRTISEKFANKDPMTIATVQTFLNQRALFEDYFQFQIDAVQQCSPNGGHKILSKWEEMGYLKGIITQNLDGYHQDAGNQEVIELHGSLRNIKCATCGKTDTSITYLFPDGNKCTCGGAMRPDIVLFGEYVPAAAVRKGDALVKTCDLLLVLGSNLQAHPANQMVYTAKRAKAFVIIVNSESTALDGVADLVVRDKRIAQFLQEVNYSITHS